MRRRPRGGLAGALLAARLLRELPLDLLLLCEQPLLELRDLRAPLLELGLELSA